LTIELRGSIPEEFRKAMGAQVFGCDICQDVCPWNNRAPVTQAAHFQPRNYAPQEDSAYGESPGIRRSLYVPDLEWLASMNEEEFREVFRDSPVKRAKWRGLVRNACIALGNAGVTRNSRAYERVVRILERLASSAEIHVAESAQWALSRIQPSK
jgi:epoxyqueuosine reductase